MKNKGWTKFHREQFSHWISEKKPWCDGYAWTCLYNMANHKPGKVNFRNEYIPVAKGQFVTSKIKLETAFGWTRRHLDNFLKALKNDEMITYRMTNRYTFITIINYELYQGDGKQNDIQNDGQITDSLHTDDIQVSTNKNDNNDNNVKNDIYTHWNKQKIICHKKNTYQSQIRTALSKYSGEEILTAITNYGIIVNNKEYYFNYRWTLNDFLKKGIDKFMDLGIAKSNYKKGDQNGRGNQNNDQSKKPGEDKYKHLEETY